MNHTLTIAILLLAAASSACDKAPQPAAPKAVPVSLDQRLRLQLLTLNLRYENSEDTAQRAWRNRIIGIVRVVREVAPDVLAIQEALHGQAADLWASLPGYHFSGCGRDDGAHQGEYSGVYFRRDRFELDPSDQGTFWLSATPEIPGSKTWGNEFPRVALWIRLIDRSSQRGFYVYNTHWDHRNQASREKAALLIAQRIDARLHPDEPIILIGDFNAVESNPAISFLTGKKALLSGQTHTWKNSLIDTFQHLNPNQTSRTTLHFWRGSREGRLKVDHILVSKGAQIRAASIRDQDHPMISDHFPVTANVEFPNP